MSSSIHFDSILFALTDLFVKCQFEVAVVDCAEIGVFLSSFLDNGWSAILWLLALLSDATIATDLFSRFSEFLGLMFEEDGDWQTMEVFAVDDCAAVEHGPPSVPEWNINIK